MIDDGRLLQPVRADVLDGRALGTSGDELLRDALRLRQPGPANRTVSPAGTITRTVYDGQGRVVSAWVGTNDTPASGYWSPTNNRPGLAQTAAYQYDGGGVGRRQPDADDAVPRRRGGRPG